MVLRNKVVWTLICTVHSIPKVYHVVGNSLPSCLLELAQFSSGIR